MAKIDTLFMTETAEKPYPLGPGNWSRYNLCDILTKPVQLSLYKRPDKRIPKFILCAVQDTKRQASSIKQK